MVVHVSKKGNNLTMKKIFYLIVFIAIASCENAELKNEPIENNTKVHFVSIDQIKQIVKGDNFNKFISKFDNVTFKKGLNESILSVTEFKEFKDKNSVTAFYMTKLSNNKFVLFATDDRSHLIMGVTDAENSDSNISDIPFEFKYWLDEEIKAIEFARANSLNQNIEIVNEWQNFSRYDELQDPYECSGSYHISKEPLLQTTWGQGSGYNNYAPNLGCTNYSNGNAPAGCVATATAQIMKFHQWPNNYTWSNMPNNFGTNSTSQLLYDIGVHTGMCYKCDGSGTKTYKAMNALKNNFGYSNALFADYNSSTVLNELKQDKPVILAGGERQYWLGLIPFYAEGHAWVTDGFMEGFTCTYDQSTGYANGGYGYLLFHMNWGWSGNFNMYCNRNNFSVNGNTFNYQRKMIYGIRK